MDSQPPDWRAIGTDATRSLEQAALRKHPGRIYWRETPDSPGATGQIAEHQVSLLIFL
ncbi:hypothetical protein [Rufibacter sp. XAAS-G3-1]|uniref:hypothetical protein n=1 Tax=Rufibacter sp. XAAS-G3-1 TaxID=2729134 RepID=UPI0015E6DD44|nr:hypothetical protein [Rufibacter sp. XAAS-G3-1]